jgi:aminobenzoyl-glutamate transport protein
MSEETPRGETGPETGGTGGRGSKSAVDRFLRFIEWAGNLLPHPGTLFAILALLVILLSGVFSAFGLEVKHPSTGATIRAENLMNLEGLHRILTKMVTNFTQFAPLGTVVVAMIGIGIAESSGLIGTALRLLVLSAPSRLLTFVVVLAGVLSNAASEIGYVLLVPLGAVIFLSVGRHPIAGMAAAFAGVSGGYSANVIIGTVDPLLAGLSTEAAKIIDPAYEVNSLCNYYFMCASTLFVAIAGTWTTEKIVEPRLGRYGGEGDPVDEGGKESKKDELEPLTADEKRGLVFASVGFVLFVAFVVWGSFAGQFVQFSTEVTDPQGAVVVEGIVVDTGGRVVAADELSIEGESVSADRLTIRDDGTLLFDEIVIGTDRRVGAEGMSIKRELYAKSPLLRGVVALVVIGATLAAVAYGIGARTIRNDTDVIEGMGKSISGLGTYIVLVFFAAQFVEYFKWTNIGIITAVNGANALKVFESSPVLLMIGFVFVSALMNLVMGSASAKWSIMAPIFVPMFMLLGQSPELTQVAYRIGDSTTNIISPMMSYFALIVAFFARYKKGSGIGTIVATMLPYTVVFTIVWSIILAIWVALGLPLGPSSPLSYTPPTGG